LSANGKLRPVGSRSVGTGNSRSHVVPVEVVVTRVPSCAAWRRTIETPKTGQPNKLLPGSPVMSQDYCTLAWLTQRNNPETPPFAPGRRRQEILHDSFSRPTSNATRVHADRAAGDHRHHRRLGWPVAPCGAEGARGRQPHEVRQ